MARKKQQQIPHREFNPNAAEERKAREDAMLARHGYVKLSKDEHARLLEREADAILAKDQLAAIAENVELIREGFESLKLPSNDPEYLKRLQTSDAQRAAIANAVEAIHIIPDEGGKTWIGVGLTNPRDHATALETAKRLGEHLEARIISHETDKGP